MTIRVLTVVGARPQFVKAAAISRAFAAESAIEEILVHTGQHYDSNMSDVFFRELRIPEPAHHLNVHGGGHGEMTARMLSGLEQLMVELRPRYVLVYGDTNSTLAGALAASKLHIPIGHVEAGLRSFNRKMPEEVNRVLADHVSTQLFCPTFAAVGNLANEGIRTEVHHVGDVMYDATLAALKQSAISGIVERLGLKEGKFAVATVHRAENTDDADRLRQIIDYLRERAAMYPVVMPLHPRTRHAIANTGTSTRGLTICEPLGYLDMTRLIAGCCEVLTDSGGVQKEAYFHRKPCVTLRDETEWIETVECGWNRLWKEDRYKPRAEISEYGDGHAAEKIVKLIQASD
jgi:UDP-GlcNAc3NAcA epimerase